MTWVATAIAGSAILGAGAQAYGANRAARASREGAEDAAGVQQYMYDTTRRDYAPYRQVGYSALGELASLYGLDAPEIPSEQDLSGQYGTYDLPMQGALTEHQVVKAFEEFAGRRPTERELEYYSDRERADQLYDNIARPALDRRQSQQQPQQQSRGQPQGGSQGGDRYAAFRESPDYQFAFEQGQRATDQSLAARGLTNSGRAAKELTRFGQGLASQQLQNYTNRLASLAGVGQTATQSLAQVGQNTAANIGSAQMNAADARASGYLGAGNAISSGIEQGWGAYNLSRMARQQPASVPTTRTPPPINPYVTVG